MAKEILTIEEIIAQIGKLTESEQLQILQNLQLTIPADKQGVLSILNIELGQLLSISDGTDGNKSTLAFKGHRLDMKIDGKQIYDHLAKYKARFLANPKYVNNKALITALTALSEKIRNIKFKEGGITGTIPGASYFRNEGLDQNVKEFTECMDALQSLGCDENDAVMFIVLIGGWPKTGYLNSNGKSCDVGDFGLIANSAASGGKVRYAYFYDDNAGLINQSDNLAILSLSN